MTTEGPTRRPTGPIHRSRHGIEITRRGRILLGALLVTAIMTLAFGVRSVAGLFDRDEAIAVPADVCASPPTLRSYQGVRLQPLAMQAFKRAERLAGQPIVVIQSYRSCRQQAAACQRICQNPGGCPDRCAPPGSSYHQLGAAIDVSGAMLRKPEVIAALEEAGWCQSVPKTDPGHFSFGGCH